jgi:hypothetical protein
MAVRLIFQNSPCASGALFILATLVEHQVACKFLADAMSSKLRVQAATF